MGIKIDASALQPGTYVCVDRAHEKAVYVTRRTGGRGMGPNNPGFIFLYHNRSSIGRLWGDWVVGWEMERTVERVYHIDE
jgi:hypothetical protein